MHDVECTLHLADVLVLLRHVDFCVYLAGRWKSAFDMFGIDEGWVG